MGALLDLLVDVVEAPFSESETAQPTTGVLDHPPTAPTGQGDGWGGAYELEPWIDEDIDD